MASEVKFQIKSGISETNIRHRCGGQQNRFKICSATRDLGKGFFSRSARKQRSKLNQNKLKNWPLCNSK